MSMDQDNSPEPATSRLVDAVRKVRIASADKSDVVVEMREAAHTRLELLAQDLQHVIDDVPADDDRFDFALSSGLQPRFWIDATAHVMMGPDRRTYRFVRDTRLGRELLGESADRSEIAESIISYIAMRIHERELALAGDTISYRHAEPERAGDADGPADSSEPNRRIDEAIAALREGGAEPETRFPGGPAETAARSVPAADDTSSRAAAAPARRRGFWQSLGGGLFWILLGAAIGGGTLLYVFRDFLLQP